MVSANDYEFNEPYAKSLAELSPDKKSMVVTHKPFAEMAAEEFRDFCARFLERGRWKRETAGEDWERGLDAFVKSAQSKYHGILVTGAYGCGKTAFVEAIRHNTRESFDVIRLANRAEVARLDPESEDFDRSYYNKLFVKRVLLDDLGAECLTNNYGIRHDVVGEFITEYHYRGREKLYITTNLSAAELMDRYGGRVADRLKELCYPLTFTGKSKRKWAK